MSSSGLTRLHLHPHGKRPFEECGGYDSDPDSSMPTTTSGTSSSARFSSPTNPETRNKRARSTSSTSTDASPSSSSGYTTAPSSSRSDILSDARSPLSTTALDCPAPSFVPTQDVHISDLHLPVPPTTAQPQRTPPSPEDTLRTSLQRFAEFDRQIAALRTSLASTRSPPLPSLGPSLDGDQIPSNDLWHSNPSNVLPPNPASSTVAVAPTDSFNSLSTFNDASVAPSNASGILPSTPFPPTFSNGPRYPPHSSYRPPLGGASSLTLQERVGDTVPTSSTPPFMRPSSSENITRLPTRSSVSLEPSAASAASHTGHVRRSLSPLVFTPNPSSSSPTSTGTDDLLLRYRAVFADVSRRRGVNSPTRLEDHPGELPRSHPRLGDCVRVVDRESVPSVFDVFSIDDQNRSAPVRGPAPSRYPIAEPVPPRGHGTHTERSRGPAPITTTNQLALQDHRARLQSSWTSIPSSNSLMSESASERRHAMALERFRARLRRSSFDADDESDSRWSGSSRGERERENSDRGVASPVPPSPSVESVLGTGTGTQFPSLGLARASMTSTNRAEPVTSTSTSLQRSLSELLADTQGNAGEEGMDTWLLDWDPSERERQAERERERERELDRERQRERVWEWQRERERLRDRLNQDVRGRSFTSGSSLASTSFAREESSHPLLPVPPRPGGQLGAVSSTATSNASTTTTTNNSQQYSYSNLNLSSFQSGLFRDSLRRNAEVDQAAFSTSAPVMPSGMPMDSHTAARVGLEDSGSEMDLDDIVRTRTPSPEWFRPQPYAGNTPPPEYSHPPRNFSFRPGFAVLHRDNNNNVNYEPPPLPLHPNRNSAMFVRPIPSGSSGQPRAASYENNNQPAPPERTERDRFLPARILESFYRSHEDGRRNTSVGAGQPYHSTQTHPNHGLASGSSAVSRNEILGPRGTLGNGSSNRPGPEVVGENRRSSLGLGGSIRSRLARFANPQSSSNVTAVPSSSRARSPPRPIGARPQVPEQRRRASLVFGGANMVEQGVRPDVRSPSIPWVVSSGHEPAVMTRDAPWRPPRSAAFPPPPSANGSSRADNVDVVSRAEEQRSRLRTLRQRLQLDRGGEGMRVFRPGVLRAAMGRRGNFGDYVPDELFDDSYEALLSLSSVLGEVRSRATPEEVISSLPTGTFKEWKKEDSETRCPICLDDYAPLDVVTKLIECPHWLHKDCLEQWLRTANTCPVCREKVKASPKPAPARRRPYREHTAPSEGVSSAASRPAQANNGRPASFAAMVFDRLMNEGRDVSGESWTSSTPAAPPGTRDGHNVYMERLRAQQQPQQQQQQQSHQPPRTHEYHEMFGEVHPPHELPFHLRLPPSTQARTSARPTSAVMNEGSGARPFGFVSLLRGQGSDSSMSTSSSAGMVVDDVGGSRRSMAGGSSGSLFLDAAPRREGGFLYVPPPPSSGFAGSAAPPAMTSLIAPAPTPAQPVPTSFDARPRTVVMSSSGEGSSWRSGRGYDALMHMEASRSSSSSSSSSSAMSMSMSMSMPMSVPTSGVQPRPMSVASRIPVDEDGLLEEAGFGFGVFGR